MIKVKEMEFPDMLPWDDLSKMMEIVFPDGHSFVASIDGERYLFTREEAIELGFIRDPSNPLTLRERIRERIRDWHGKRAVYHERKSIGLD